MTTSQGAGVVTAFILMSDAKDEIDFEWIGVDTEHVQSNYYFQGITNCKFLYYCGAHADRLMQVHRQQRSQPLCFEHGADDAHIHDRLVSR